MRKKISDIQILRSIAIILVLFQHFDLVHIIALQLPIYIMPPFSQGVRLFFVISGYVVARSLLSGSQIKPFQFIIKRIFRIYPILLLFLVFTAGVNWLLQIPSIQSLNVPTIKADQLPWYKFWDLTVRTITGTYINTEKFEQIPLFGAMWSLSVEFQFYAVVAILGLVLCLLLRFKKSFVEYFLLILCSLLYIICLINEIALLGTGSFVTQHPLLTYLITWSFDFLCLGFALAIAEKKNLLSRLKFLKISREQALFIAPYLILLPLILSGLTRSETLMDSRVYIGLASPLTAISYTFLVYLAATVGCFPGADSRTYQGFYWIGETSYSIYLFHIPIKVLVMIIYGAIFPPTATAMDFYLQGIYQIVIMTAILVPLIYFLYYNLEIPFIDYSYQLINGNFLKNRRKS